MRLPHWVQDPALVRVGSSFVRSAGDDGCGVGTILVRYVVDGEGVFVVAVANVAAEVLLVGATVDDALSVMDVAWDDM